MFRLLQIYKSILRGIGFIPLLITVVLICAALFLTLAPPVQSSNSFVYWGGYFEVRTSETARAVLTSIFTGIISITVFGFSMMIVVINQAASNYSPKVVETLSGQRSNQYILGMNLGTIIFTLIVTMHIDNKKADGGIPELAILVNMILAIYCLLLFVRFINNISNSVRINNIIKMVYKKTKHSIAEDRKQIRHETQVDTHGWPLYPADHSGYFQLIRTKPLLRKLQEVDATIQILPRPGSYYLHHEPLFAASKALDEKTVRSIRSEFVTYAGENIGENAMYGFRQLREIAVKGLSPGINDPGVAVLCIEYLAELLSLQIQNKSRYCLRDADGNPRIIMHGFDFKSLLEIGLLPIKYYGRKDYNVLSALLHSARQIAFCANEDVKPVLQAFARSVVQVADENIEGPVERELLNAQMIELNGSRDFDLPFLAGVAR